MQNGTHPSQWPLVVPYLWEVCEGVGMERQTTQTIEELRERYRRLTGDGSDDLFEKAQSCIETILCRHLERYFQEREVPGSNPGGGTSG